MLRLVTTLAILVWFGCDTHSKRRPGDERVKPDGITQIFSKEGILLREVSMRKGKQHGPSKEFHISGKVSHIIEYQDGKKQGKASWYYESGKLKQETEFADNRVIGMQRKFYENGQLMSEVKFQYGEPCSGLKEYSEQGELIQEYPRIEVRAVDELVSSGRYTLELTMSNGNRKVGFYTGSLTAEGCLGTKTISVPMRKAGLGEIIYFLPPNSFKMEEINIIARFETHLDNYKVTQRKYRLAIDN